MIVKCMGSENAPDDDSRKQYRIISGVKIIEFVRKYDDDKDAAVACLTMDDGTFHEEYCYGNVYVMNDAGKTVSSFGVAQIPKGA